MQRIISIHTESCPKERTLGNIIYLQCLMSQTQNAIITYEYRDY